MAPRTPAPLAALLPALRPRLRAVQALNALAGALMIATAGLLAGGLDRLIFAREVPDLLTWGLAAGLIAGRALATFGAGLIAADLGFAAQAQIRARLFARLLAPPGPGPTPPAAAETATLATDGAEALSPFLSAYLPAITQAAVLPLAILAVVAPLDWLSALTLAVTAPLIPLFMILIGAGAERLNLAQWAVLARLAAAFLDAVQALPLLRLFAATGRETARIAQAAEAYRSATMRVLRVAFLSALALEILATLGVALVAVFLGFRLLWGDIGYDRALFILLLAPEFYLPLRGLGAQYHARMDALAAAARLAPLLADPAPSPAAPSPRSAALAPVGPAEAGEAGETRGVGPETAPTAPAAAPAAVPLAPPPRPGPRVVLEGVSFAYPAPSPPPPPPPPPSPPPSNSGVADPGARPKSESKSESTWGSAPMPPALVLDRLSVTLEPGSLTALVGASGAGKSTLLALLRGALAPTAGRLLVDGLPLDPVRHRPAWVPQHPRLFAGTIAQSLRLGAPEAADASLWEALRRVGAEAVVANRPLGLETPLGEGGRGLSGGELRRLALARALLADAPLVLMDEPSASLDHASEEALIAALASLRSGRTVVIAAHRLSTLRIADRILVLEGGHLVADGPFAPLAADPTGPLARLIGAGPPLVAAALAARAAAGHRS